MHHQDLKAGAVWARLEIAGRRTNTVASCNEERRLFEQAIAELDAVTPAKLARSKGGAEAAGRSGAKPPAHSRRLDKRRRTAEPEAVVDLHGLDRRAAVACVRRFIAENRSCELLLVVHGKGRGILQERITTFLNAEPCVVEHIVAPQRLGGAGARLVRLRRVR